ncbi:MAG: DNA repair protein RecO [Chlamydiae bacterium]|nr:DNA repair protein RecO [Chlamydiota bacterium]
MTIKTKGVVLKVLRYSDTQEIHTLFTEELGILSLITKSKKKENLPPLYEGEFVLKKGKSFFQLIEAKQTAFHHKIRESLEAIETAFKLIHILLKSQMPLKSAPALYALFSAFLKNISQVNNQGAFRAVFIAKLLFHEGHLDPDHPLLAHLATIKSFKEMDSLKLEEGSIHEIDRYFDEAYEFLLEKKT